MAVEILKEEKIMKHNFLLFIGLIAILSFALTGCGTASSENTAAKEDDEKKEQTATQKQEEQEKYYFTANEGGSISKINVAENKVEATIEVDGTAHNVQVSSDGKILGVTLVPKMDDAHGNNHGAGHGEGQEMGMTENGKALFFDIESNELLKTVEVGSHPAHIVFTEDGNLALVSNNGDNTVSVIDMKDYSVIDTVPTGNGPHGFRISQDSKYAYVANMGEDTVSVINIETLKEEKKIKVGQTPVTTGITSDGKTLVVTLNAENALAVVDLETGQVEKVEVGKGPAQVYIDVNAFAYVANQGTKAAPSNSMSIVDLVSKEVVSTIETGNGSHGVVTSADKKFAYVTNMFENTVSVIDIDTKKVKQTIEVGEIPNGISIMN